MMEKVTALMILIVLLHWTGLAMSDEVIFIADGDTEGLIRVINVDGLSLKSNPPPGETRIVQLAANGRYVFTEATAGIFVNASLRLMGNGATWTGITNGRIHITSSGDLDIEKLNISDFTIVLDGTSHPFSTSPGAPWITNRGNLRIRDSAFTNVIIENRKYGLTAGLIDSRGAFKMENTTVSNLRYDAISGLDIDSALLLVAGPDSRLTNNTITLSGAGSGSAPALFVARGCPVTASICAGFHFSLENNILTGNTLPLCQGPVTSLGHNIFSDESCGPLSIGDRLIENFDLLPLSDAFGPVPVHPLLLGSPAIDAAGQARCTQFDATGASRLSDGDGDGIANCDIGAFESPGAITAGNGLLNGLFLEAGSDGHFVQIMEISPRGYAIFWSTFDQDGQPAWVFAIGDRNRATITADAFISLDGQLEADGQPRGQETIPWGDITVVIEDCRRGSFSYESSLPEFGSGRFELERLAFVHALGCD